MKRPAKQWRQTARKWREPDGDFLESREYRLMLRMFFWEGRYSRSVRRQIAIEGAPGLPW